MCGASLGDLCQATAESVLALSSMVKKSIGLYGP